MNEKPGRTADEQKRAAAERAAALVVDGSVVGLGTGSTADLVLEAIARRRRAGQLGDIVGIPTSVRTEQRARELDIPLLANEELREPDITLDGADEVDPALDLIKGLGGALLREKIVASISRRLVIVVDAAKRVRRLGERAPVPVEVVPFWWQIHLARFRELGVEPALRRAAGGEPVVTDGGNYVIDCRAFGGIVDASALARDLRDGPGVIETGLFLGMADLVIVGTDGGVELLERHAPAAQPNGEARAW